jgi:hypothetical protein
MTGLFGAPKHLLKMLRIRQFHVVCLRILRHRLTLVHQFTFGLSRVGRGNEGSGFEMPIPTERLVEPDGEFACHLQLMQRLASVAGVLMCRLITSLAQAVKGLRNLRVDDLAILELVEQVALGGAFFDRNAGVGSGVLGQEFTKLAEFDQGRIRVIKDIAFGKGGVADEHLIVPYEEREVW